MRQNPLTVLLWSALVVPMAVAALTIIVLYEDVLRDGRSSATDQALILREHALRVLDAQISAIAYIDERIAGMDWQQIRNSRQIHEVLKRVARVSPHIDGIWLIPPDGRTANSADFFPIPAGTTAVARDYYRVLREQDETYLGGMIRGYLKGNLNFNVSRRRTSADGSFDGLILITSNLGYFSQFWDTVTTAGQIAFLVRADGEILARHPAVESPPPTIASDSPFFALTQGKTPATFEHRSHVDGKDRLYSVIPLAGFSAFIGVGTNREVLLAPWKRLSISVAVAATLLTLCLAALVLLATRYQNSLKAEVARRRDAEELLVEREEHVSALQAADARLRASEERFRALFETTTQGVLHIDRDNRILTANPTAERTFGVPASNMVGRSIIHLGLDVVDENESPLPPNRRISQVALQTGKTIKDFVMGVRAKGSASTCWLQVDAVPQWRAGEDRPWSVFLLFSDITEQRRAARIEKVLAAEVDHRAKNMLALVQAIVRLSKSASPETFAATLEGRISSLARAHSLLADSKWGDVSLRATVEEAVNPYENPNDGRRIVLDGPDLTLRPAAVQPVSLMFHELATNAAKYGALAVPSGKLRVQWTVDEDLIRISWRETGGPEAREPEKVSFGSRLITLTLEGDLGGKIDRNWLPQGLHAIIAIPAFHKGTESGAAAHDAPHEGRSEPTAFDGLTAFVTEDNAVIAAGLEDQLRELGFTVLPVAATFDEAMAAAESSSPDVAILDVDLRGRAVFPVAEKLRAKGVPVAFCTGFANLADLGAHWPRAVVIQKPVERNDLLGVLAHLLRSRTAARTAAS